MRKAILQNDVIDVIYDSICGYPLDKAYEILENHSAGKYIPKEWLERKGMILAANKYDFSAGVIRIVIKEWEKENGK